MLSRSAVILVTLWLLASFSPRHVLAARAAVREEVISFQTHDGLEIQGILSFPRRGTGPFPGLLLIHGSGLHDADMEIDIPNLWLTNGRQEHFKKLARFLSKRGYAVLRYNKRGASFNHAADRPLDLLDATFDDLVEDARSAMTALYSDSRVAASPLVIWGWSEGTMIAPRLAREHSEISLLVLVGPAARSLRDIIRYQLVDRYVDFYRRAGDENRDGFLTFEEMNRLDGRGGTGSFYVHDLADELYGVTGEEILAGAPIDGFQPTLDLNRDGRLDIAAEIAPVYEEVLRRALDSIRDGRSEYERSLFEVRPLEEFVDRVRTPMILAQGEADNQTPVEESERLIARLQDRGRDYEALFFPGLGHSLSPMTDFYTGDGGLTTLDNPTLNVMKKKIMRTIERAIRTRLEGP